jgi:hypothetical protein
LVKVRGQWAGSGSGLFTVKVHHRPLARCPQDQAAWQRRAARRPPRAPRAARPSPVAHHSIWPRQQEAGTTHGTARPRHWHWRAGSILAGLRTKARSRPVRAPPPYLRRGRGTLWLHAPVNTGPHDGAHVRREERLHLVCRQRVVHLDGRDADLLRVRATARF